MIASTHSPLMEVAARLGATNIDFVVDTGAAVSVIPKKYVNGVVIYPTNISIVAANGIKIECCGQAVLTLALHNMRRDYTWTFLIAETTKPLLGYDFLSHFNLLIDCTNNKLIDETTNRHSKTQPSSTVMNIDIDPEKSISGNIKNIIDKYPNLISPHKDPTAVKPKVFHRIETGSNPPSFSKARQLSPQKHQIALDEFRKLQKAGIISPSKSEWSTALHMVPKSDDTYRPVGDYRLLNSITKPDRYPIPNINSLSSKLHNKKVFSKIDLSSAYHQIPVHPDDICKTAITTPFGLYEYNFMPFGLRNASSTFQRMMDSIFRDIDYTFTYIDDILVFSDDEEDHSIHLENVLKKLSEYDFKISLSKCTFNVTELEFLGFHISSSGLSPSKKKLNELAQFSQPEDSKSLRRFIGMANFYRKLIPRFSNIILPLTERMRIEQKSKSLTLNKEEVESFENVKRCLVDASALAFPDSKTTNYQLVTDSSNYAVGAALHQMINDEPVPIGFFSKKLSQTQQKYSTFDRELLASYLSVLHFKHLIEGRNVLLLTDHKPLCNAFNSQSTLKSDRQQRHLSFITEYITDISYIKGSQNVVADCLSRPANAINVDLCDLQEILIHQENDAEIQSYIDRLKPYSVDKDRKILCDVSLPFPRPFVTHKLRKSVFNSLHDLSHPGIAGSTKLIKSRYFWPEMNKSIKNWCRECQHCQQAKITTHSKSTVKPFSLPSSRFQTVHIDIAGPLLPVKNPNDPYFAPYRYILTCIDRSTRWIEACPLSEITAKAVSLAFVDLWISRFGVPLHVVTDRGSQFESELFAELSKIIGFHRLRTTAYHPQTNGMVERAHRTLKTAIMARKESWLTALPIVLLGIRITPNESTYSPFTAVTGSYAQVPRLLVDSEENDNMDFTNTHIKTLTEEMQKFNMDNFSNGHIHTIPDSHVPKDLQTCEKVWLRTDRVRKPLEAPYTGPFLVVKRHNKYFTLKMSENMNNNVSVDRLKPAYISASSKTKDIVENNSEIDNSQDKFDNINTDTQTKKTKSGRTVRWKKENTYVYY